MACACQHGPRVAARDAERTPTPLDTATTGTISRVTCGSTAMPPAPHPVEHRERSDLRRGTSGRASPSGGVRGRGGYARRRPRVRRARARGPRCSRFPDTAVVVDQRGCLFEPPIAAARAGQRYRVREQRRYAAQRPRRRDGLRRMELRPRRPRRPADDRDRAPRGPGARTLRRSIRGCAPTSASSRIPTSR